MGKDSALFEALARGLMLANDLGIPPEEINYEELYQPRFGEVTWFANRLWQKIAALHDVRTRSDEHAGLCVTEQLPVLAFGTTMDRLVSPDDPTCLVVQGGECENLSHATLFLLHFRLRFPSGNGGSASSPRPSVRRPGPVFARNSTASRP